MTRAEQNKSMMSWIDSFAEANELADAYEQDCGNETTSFEWSDGSVSLFLGIEQEIITYGSRN